MIGSLSGGKGKSNVPCVGVSFGVERLYTLMKRNIEKNEVKVRTSATHCYVMSGQKGMLKHRAEIISDLWAGDIPAETSYKVDNVKNISDEKGFSNKLLSKVSPMTFMDAVNFLSLPGALYFIVTIRSDPSGALIIPEQS